jgi:hypothetical protein
VRPLHGKVGEDYLKENGGGKPLLTDKLLGTRTENIQKRGVHPDHAVQGPTKAGRR